MSGRRNETSATTARGSIRRQLFVQLLAVAAILSLAFFLIVREVAGRVAEATQDDILAASATSIADSLRFEGGEVTLDLPYSALSMLGTINEDRVFYRIVADGRTLTGYDDLPQARPSATAPRPQFATFDYRGDRVRAVTLLRPVGSGSTPVQVAVSVAQTRLGMAAISARITSIATAIGVGFFVVATALSLLAARSALSPLARMTLSVTRRGPADLRPLRTAAPRELVPFVDALNGFMARLRTALGQSEDFITEAAHRVRTPLATLRAQAEVTYRKLERPEHRQALREMIRAIDESARSAGQMLDHAMVTLRTDSVAHETVRLDELVRETCDRFAPTAGLKDIEIVTELPPAPVVLAGDRILLQNALHNVLDNAVKYSPADSTITVRLSAEPGAPRRVRLSVADQGRGFDGRDLKQLTRRFSRGSNVGDIVGSGLGLTIADEVARAHGGHLDISENSPGAGACIALVLPSA